MKDFSNFKQILIEIKAVVRLQVSKGGARFKLMKKQFLFLKRELLRILVQQ